MKKKRHKDEYTKIQVKNPSLEWHDKFKINPKYLERRKLRLERV